MTTFPGIAEQIMAFALFRKWFGPAHRQRPDLDFLVYTRAVCPLCDEAWELLEGYQKQHGFILRTQDIDESTDLQREHGEWIPVVRVNGRVRFRGKINEVLLRRILDADQASD